MVMFLLMNGITAQATAAVSQDTDTVKGRAPIVSGVTVSNQTKPGIPPRVGSILRVDYSFSDPDDDDESGTAIQWLRNGSAIGGATSAIYTATTADGGARLSARITPHTATSSTDPSSGTPLISAALEIVVGALPVGRFLAPPTAPMNYTNAKAYCQSRGARLPTETELVQLYHDSTSAPEAGYSNPEMCTVYGWPNGGVCGGQKNTYWIAGETSFYRHYIYMDNGGKGTGVSGDSHQVTCLL